MLTLAATLSAAQTSSAPVQATPVTPKPIASVAPVQASPGTDPAIAPTVVRKPRTRAPKPDTIASTNLQLVVLDAAHGGPDNGAPLGSGVLEKDVTAAFAARLRAALQTKGFTVTMAHEKAEDDTALDARLETANRAHALACLLLHASATGHGVHLLPSGLMPVTAADPSAIVPWDTQQAPVVERSLRLAGDVAAALGPLRIPLLTNRISVAPIDSMTCPALAVELAPLAGDTPTPVTDAGYQQRVADALVQGLLAWRGQMANLQAEAAAAAAKAAASAPAAKPTPTPARKTAKPVVTTPPASPQP